MAVTKEVSSNSTPGSCPSGDQAQIACTFVTKLPQNYRVAEAPVVSITLTFECFGPCTATLTVSSL